LTPAKLNAQRQAKEFKRRRERREMANGSSLSADEIRCRADRQMDELPLHLARQVAALDPPHALRYCQNDHLTIRFGAVFIAALKRAIASKQSAILATATKSGRCAWSGPSSMPTAATASIRTWPALYQDEADDNLKLRAQVEQLEYRLSLFENVLSSRFPNCRTLDEAFNLYDSMGKNAEMLKIEEIPVSEVELHPSLEDSRFRSIAG
jgi:hypothetical protein